MQAGSGRTCCSVLILLASCVTYTIAVCTVKTLDDGRRNCSKRAQFYFKNEFEELVYLGGFISIIYHDARSNKCHIKLKYF